jgi:peptidoglycan hydrolase CwlO-like protein
MWHMCSVERRNRDLKKTIFTLSVAATVGLSTTFGGIPANNVAAESIDSLKQKSNEIQQKQSNLEGNINDATNQLEANQAEQNKVTSEINRIDLAIGDAETKIVEKNQQIEQKNAEITQLNSEIDALIVRIEQRTNLLKDRARSYQESGGMVSYIDVLVGAQSFSDFIDRVGAVATILEADQDIMRELNADKELLEKKQAQLKQDLADLETMRAELEGLKAELAAQKSEKDALMATLKQQEAQVNDLLFSLEEEQEILANQDAAIKQAIELEQKRQAEAAKAAAAAAAKAAAANKGSSGGGGGSVSAAPAVSSGSFTRPAAGSLTSGFGYRSFNGGGFHYGVDIAKGGTVPIVAAADGVVSDSRFSSSYGNVIMITHVINGTTYTTVYAHLSSRSVGVGTPVSKGQQIGYMGNTGNSFGQHLHFELHRGPWNGAKSNAINPVGIVPL